MVSPLCDRHCIRNGDPSISSNRLSVSLLKHKAHAIAWALLIKKEDVSLRGRNRTDAEHDRDRSCRSTARTVVERDARNREVSGVEDLRTSSNAEDSIGGAVDLHLNSSTGRNLREDSVTTISAQNVERVASRGERRTTSQGESNNLRENVSTRVVVIPGGAVIGQNLQEGRVSRSYASGVSLPVVGVRESRTVQQLAERTVRARDPHGSLQAHAVVERRIKRTLGSLIEHYFKYTHCIVFLLKGL